MGYQHGITGRENATSVVAAKTTGITPVYVGTAPINLCKEKKVNVPILCYSYAEAVENFGYSNDFDSYTLCEAIDAHFSKFGIGPIVLINVLNHESHKESIPEATITAINKKFIIQDKGILPETVKVDDNSEFISQFDEDGNLIIILETEGKTTIKVTYDKLKPSMITTADIIGGIDVKGNKTGLEAIASVYPKYRLIPNLILAPKWSTDSTVAAVMETKANLINGHFKGMALIDLSTKEVFKYSEATEKKNANNIVSTNQNVYWPMVGLGESKYHLSTQAACIIQKLASENSDIPYKSPSNKPIKADKLILENGSEVLLGLDEANYLNGNGINTAINFMMGWTIWGNRTSCYPGNTDPKDAFIASRLMFNWLNNYLVETFWQKVDDPTNKTLINTIVDSINIFLNGQTASGTILGGRVEFRGEDNPSTSLMNGKISFRVYFTPTLPAEEIEFVKEIDVNLFGTLFK